MRRAAGKGMKARRLLFAVLSLLPAICCCGCDSHTRQGTLTLTASAFRAERRAYDGAPPVIPHPPLNITCMECHTATGKEAPPLGFAPANPHARTSGLSGTRNCQQCHVFRRDGELFHENDFAGLSQHFAKA